MQSIRVSLAVLFATALVSVVGCSSDSGSTGAVTSESACSDLGTLFCDKLATGAPIFLQGEYGDSATCKARLKTDCLTGLSAPNNAQTPDTLKACINAGQGLSIQQLVDQDLPAACTPPTGPLDDAKACSEHAQCKSGFCAVNPSSTTECGVCNPKPVEGAACPQNDCPQGLVCHNQKCTKPVGAGAACDADKRCITGYSCVAAVCTKHVTTEGAACKGTNADCDGLAGLVCFENKCKKITLAAAGKECGLDFDTTVTPQTLKSLTTCEKNGYCKGLDVVQKKFKGVCEPAAGDGAACSDKADWMSGPKCLAPARCVGGVCRLKDPSQCK